MTDHFIDPRCAKCRKRLTDEELEAVRQALDEAKNLPIDKTKPAGAFCKKCTPDAEAKLRAGQELRLPLGGKLKPSSGVN